jgi:diguanylate cyclase (GGDEF)-like protein
MVVFFAFGHVLGRQADALGGRRAHGSSDRLRNQRAFEERLAEEVARTERYGGTLSLLIADVDGLKAVNDRRRPPRGQPRPVGPSPTRCARDARQTDLAARIGGDEFALLAPTPVPARRWRSATGYGAWSPSRVGAGVTISIGVATLGAEQSDAEALASIGRRRPLRGEAPRDGTRSWAVRAGLRASASPSAPGAGQRLTRPAHLGYVDAKQDVPEAGRIASR